MNRLLIQTQLSNYDAAGKFILEADSGWQMTMGRVREMLKLYPDLDVTVMGPSDLEYHSQCITSYDKVNPDIWEKYGYNWDEGEDRLHYIGNTLLPNALATRHDFDWSGIACNLDLGMQKINRAPKWDIVIINDPMHLRNFKTMFHVVGGYQPKFVVHSHFIDNPECPKFPVETSLWLGQCEAAIRADYNFWQCESAMNVFFESMREYFVSSVVEAVRKKSSPWDDGYSMSEVNLATVDIENIRFDYNIFSRWRVEKKHIIFVPNRIGGKGRSSDYTNCGKFMFEILPKLRKRRQDFVVVAGNPSQKFTNDELELLCEHNGYVNLVPATFTRDEFKVVARLSDVAIGLYDQDSYGGTAARECIELGCMPLWLDNYEYSSIAREAGIHSFLCKPDFTDIVDKLDEMLNVMDNDPQKIYEYHDSIRNVVRRRCSYESTTPGALDRMTRLL